MTAVVFVVASLWTINSDVFISESFESMKGMRKWSVRHAEHNKAFFPDVSVLFSERWRFSGVSQWCGGGSGGVFAWWSCWLSFGSSLVLLTSLDPLHCSCRFSCSHDLHWSVPVTRESRVGVPSAFACWCFLFVFKSRWGIEAWTKNVCSESVGL